MDIHPAIEKILNKRGIRREELDEFLSLRPQKMYDPFLLPYMDEGVDLILSSIENDEKICIYGDYDADGVTSVSVLMEVLGNLTDNITYYIPSRFTEGYGLNKDALRRIKDEGTDLVVTVDCGSVSVDEVECGKEIGLKILVTDHHTVTDRRADCPIINPKLPESNYPFRELAGVGVAFKLSQAIVNVTGLPKQVLTRVLDLVAIGTIGDIVPLVDENRTLAKYGLRLINVTERKGLTQLIEDTGLKKGNVTSENISFVLAPHINASGRMGTALDAAILMQADNTEVAKEKTEVLINHNKDRREQQDSLYETCKKVVDENYKDDNIILLQLRNAHQGITGIVAGKLKEHYEVPVIILTHVENDIYKGTGRSVSGINLYDLLKKAEHLFDSFGGHKAACGLTIKKDNIKELRRILKEETDKIASDRPELFKEDIESELLLNIRDLNMDFIEGQNLMEPFGEKNPKPTISLRIIPDNIRRVGNNGQYLSFTGKTVDSNDSMGFIVFKEADQIEKTIRQEGITEITGTVSKNSFNGVDRVQVMVMKAEKV